MVRQSADRRSGALALDRSDWPGTGRAGHQPLDRAYYRKQAPNGELPAERTDRIISFFEALLSNGPGRSRRLELERIADDSTPDGADDTTGWLDD